MEDEKFLVTIFKILSKACVYYPFEVIIIIVSVCISLSLLASPSINYHQATTLSLVAPTAKTISQNEKTHISYYSFSFVMLLRIFALVCLFIQFKNLKKIQSKFILTLSIIITVISSILLNNALINWIEVPNNLILIVDLVIYTLVLIDMKTCNEILNNALDAPTLKEAKLNLIRNFADFASESSLNTFFLVLLIALGNLSDLSEIKGFSQISCLLLTSNFFIFITIYPALLSLVLQFKKKDKPKEGISSKRSFVDKQLSETIASTPTADNSDLIHTLSSNIIKKSASLSHSNSITSENDGKSLPIANPVLVYVKLLMTIFLLVIHLKSKFFNDTSLNQTSPDFDEQLNLNDEQKIKTFHIHNDEKKFNNMPNKTAQTDDVIFYTECCMLFMLIVYMVADLISNKKQATATTTTNTTTSTTQQHTSHFYLPSSSSQSNQPAQSVIVVSTKTVSTQTESNEVKPAELNMNTNRSIQNDSVLNQVTVKRSLKECLDLINECSSKNLVDDLTDEEVHELVANKYIAMYKLESHFSNPIRGIRIRRQLLEPKTANRSLSEIPFESYNYKKVIGSCCENIVGYIPVPLGVAGPILVDGKFFHIPMATTEGTLIASTNRGCNALSANEGVFTKILSDGMTRGPVVSFPSAIMAGEAKEWIENEENFDQLKKAFESTSRYAKLQSIKCTVAARYLYMRFLSYTGDAMGMNMLSKGSEKALILISKQFPEAHIMSVSGNYCTDKKPSAMNWIEGRGKSVVCEAIVKADTVKKVLKTSVKALVDLNLSKNLVGSAMAGSIGGFNAHAANIVTAMFIACGQDPAQVVESCNCLTWMESTGKDNEDLYISCTMPSLEVGTVGGGTALDAQSNCLKMLGIHGSNEENPGQNASTLARVISAAVLAGELSLMSALASGHLVNSHMKYNRTSVALAALAAQSESLNV